MNNKRVALYARVSTLAGQSPEMQLVELREYAARRGWLIIEEYVDHGISGAKESRPALNRLMADARQRKFDILLVWKIDRFGRSLKHLVNSLAELESVGVTFVSLRDSLDLSSPAGRLMAQLLGAISEFERSLITERVRAGIRNCPKQGPQAWKAPTGSGLRQDRPSTRLWSLTAGHFGAAWRFGRQCPPRSALQKPLASAPPPPSPSP